MRVNTKYVPTVYSYNGFDSLFVVGQFITFCVHNLFLKANWNRMSTCFLMQSRVDFMQLMVEAQISEGNHTDPNSTKGRDGSNGCDFLWSHGWGVTPLNVTPLNVILQILSYECFSWGVFVSQQQLAVDCRSLTNNQVEKSWKCWTSQQNYRESILGCPEFLADSL